MSKEQDNKAIVGRWFTDFWGKTCNLDIVDELAAPDMLLQYSLHDPRRGRADIKAFMTDFRKAFPDLNFWGTADLIAEGDHVVGRREGGGTHTGPAFDDCLAGSLPAATGRKTYAEAKPETVARARALRRGPPRMSLRKVAAALASEGHVTAKGRPYVATAVQAMLSMGMAAGRVKGSGNRRFSSLLCG